MSNAQIRHKSQDLGAEISHKDATWIPADATFRPLRDQMIVEPLDILYSAIIDVIHETKPMKGIVKAIGPGHYPKCYNHRDKAKRTKMWDSKTFKPTTVKVGDTIALGGYQYGGYSFQTFYWGDKLHVICREEDVAFVFDP